MSLHLLKHRVLDFNNVDPPDLPDKIHLEILLAPEDAFGEEGTSNRTTLKVGEKAKLRGNLNDGSNEVEGSLIDLIELTIHKQSFNFKFTGRKLEIFFECSSYEQLYLNLASINHCIPTYLSLYLSNYIWIKSFHVCIGNKNNVFIYRLKDTYSNFYASTKESSTENIEKAISNWLETGGRYDRILCASLYWRQAQNFIYSNHDIAKFSSEILLNLSKSIEVIFTSNRDNIRSISKEMGLSDNLVEEQLIPINLVRNQLDIAHVTTGILDHEERNMLIDFLRASNKNVKNLLQEIIGKYLGGEVKLRDINEKLEKDKKELLEIVNGYL